jgi:hypothetical protein
MVRMRGNLSNDCAASRRCSLAIVFAVVQVSFVEPIAQCAKTVTNYRIVLDCCASMVKESGDRDHGVIDMAE